MRELSAGEANEFKNVYGLEVITVPLRRPLARPDLADGIYRTSEEKYAAIVAEIESAHQRLQPVLVGVASIEKSELLANRLKKRGFMLAVVRDTDAPYALRIACIGAMIEIAPHVGTDDGSDYDGAWLQRVTGIARRTCDDLFSSYRSLGSGLATVLIGTEDEDRKGVRKLGAMTPARQQKAVAAVKEFHTKRLTATDRSRSPRGDFTTIAHPSTVYGFDAPRARAERNEHAQIRTAAVTRFGGSRD